VTLDVLNSNRSMGGPHTEDAFDISIIAKTESGGGNG